jgi:hypothetical protein
MCLLFFVVVVFFCFFCVFFWGCDLVDGFGRALASAYRQTVFYLGFSLMNLFFPNYFIVFQLIHFPCY